MIDLSGKQNSRKAYQDIQQTHGAVQQSQDGIWHWLNGVATSVAHFFTGRVEAGFKTVLDAFHTVVDGYKEFIATFTRLTFWIQIHVLKYLYNLIMRQYQRALAKLAEQVRYLERLIYVTTQTVLSISLHAVRAERSQRIGAIAHAEATLRALIRLTHQQVEREAASAYRVQYDQRTATIVRLLEFAVTRNPALRVVVGDLIKGVLDLAVIDDPILRLALGFAIRDVIDRLGIDKAAGQLANDLLAPILGNAKPRNLHDVVKDMGDRLVAAEAFEATFMADGGSEVEQAGRLWRDLTQPAVAAGLAGFITLGALNPDGWARTINDVIGAPANTLLADASRLLKGV